MSTTRAYVYNCGIYVKDLDFISRILPFMSKTWACVYNPDNYVKHQGSISTIPPFMWKTWADFYNPEICVKDPGLCLQFRQVWRKLTSFKSKAAVNDEDCQRTGVLHPTPEPVHSRLAANQRRSVFDGQKCPHKLSRWWESLGSYMAAEHRLRPHPMTLLETVFAGWLNRINIGVRWPVKLSQYFNYAAFEFSPITVCPPVSIRRETNRTRGIVTPRTSEIILYGAVSGPNEPDARKKNEQRARWCCEQSPLAFQVYFLTCARKALSFQVNELSGSFIYKKIIFWNVYKYRNILLRQCCAKRIQN